MLLSPRIGRLLSAAGAVLLIVALFLVWYDIARTAAEGPTTSTGWETFPRLRIVLLAGAALTLVTALAPADARRARRPHRARARARGADPAPDRRAAGPRLRGERAGRRLRRSGRRARGGAGRPRGLDAQGRRVLPRPPGRRRGPAGARAGIATGSFRPRRRGAARAARGGVAALKRGVQTRYATPARRAGAPKLSSAIYGQVVATSTTGALGLDDELSTTAVLVGVVATMLVFWLAHAYAELLADSIIRPHRVTPRDVGAQLLAEWPIAQAAWPTVVTLGLALAGVWSRDTAVSIALWLGAIALAGWGAVVGRRAGKSWPRDLADRLPRGRARRHDRAVEDRAALTVAGRVVERRRPESNRCTRLCRPLRSHSATAPGRRLTC